MKQMFCGKLELKVWVAEKIVWRLQKQCIKSNKNTLLPFRGWSIILRRKFKKLPENIKKMPLIEAPKVAYRAIVPLQEEESKSRRRRNRQ